MDIRAAITLIESAQVGGLALAEAQEPLVIHSAQEAAALIEREYDTSFKLQEDATTIHMLNGAGQGGGEWHFIKGMMVLAYYADGVGKSISATLPKGGSGVTYLFERLRFEKVASQQGGLTLVRQPGTQGRSPVFTTHEDYHQGIFYLPAAKVSFYDDPYEGVGDDGYTVEELKAEIAKDGQEQPIEVGYSLHDMAHRNDHGINAFNGNHRLAAIKELGIPMVMCENSEADDADPLTRADILALGGKLG
jgi:hypothetical protein